MYAVNFRGHDANFYEADEARCHETEARPDTARSKPNNLVLRPHKPWCLNISAIITHYRHLQLQCPI